MFVVNFDFSQYHSHFKFLLVNVPVVITQFLTYPLQRIQTNLITRDQYITKNQFNQSRLILKQMMSIQKFPKFLHGVRYSVDYSVTLMTTKFFVFDWLMELSAKDYQKNIKFNQKGEPQIIQQNHDTLSQMKAKLGVYFKCIFANTLGTILSQSAFNYQILASSLPIDAKNRSQDVKQKMLEFTKSKKKIPLMGLKYTVPVSIYNTIIEVFLIEKLTKYFKINQDPAANYTVQQLSTAFSTFFLTGFAFHYSYLRQVQLVMNLKAHSIPFQKGIFGTFTRHIFRGLSLYTLYFLWFQRQSRNQVGEMFQKREANINKLPTYRK